jgi:hypothetical protein
MRWQHSPKQASRRRARDEGRKTKGEGRRTTINDFRFSIGLPIENNRKSQIRNWQLSFVICPWSSVVCPSSLVVVAVALDWLIGDPPNALHPVAWFGTIRPGDGASCAAWHCTRRVVVRRGNDRERHRAGGNARVVARAMVVRAPTQCHCEPRSWRRSNLRLAHCRLLRFARNDPGELVYRFARRARAQTDVRVARLDLRGT